MVDLQVLQEVVPKALRVAQVVGPKADPAWVGLRISVALPAVVWPRVAVLKVVVPQAVVPQVVVPQVVVPQVVVPEVAVPRVAVPRAVEHQAWGPAAGHRQPAAMMARCWTC